MRVEEKQTVQVIAAPRKLMPISPTVKHEQFQRADNSDLCRKVKKGYEIVYAKIYYAR